MDWLVRSPDLIRIEQGWADFSRVRATSNFFKVLQSTQGRRYSLSESGHSNVLAVHRSIVIDLIPTPGIEHSWDTLGRAMGQLAIPLENHPKLENEFLSEWD
ncbi:hypothetical protein TNCV_2225081 [Trichonephila clavipes]|nr:hypothetical protein TNCV_2225081 [Trichonephila clavipes]